MTYYCCYFLAPIVIWLGTSRSIDGKEEFDAASDDVARAQAEAIYLRHANRIKGFELWQADRLVSRYLGSPIQATGESISTAASSRSARHECPRPDVPTASDTNSCRAGPLAKKVVWPINSAGLAALIDIGLSDAQIGAYFSVELDDVHVLRNHYKLPADHDDDFGGTRRHGQSGLLQMELDGVGELLHELADGLTAARFYLLAAQRIAPNDDVYLDLLGETAGQVTRVAVAYSRLRTCLEPGLPQDG